VKLCQSFLNRNCIYVHGEGEGVVEKKEMEMERGVGGGRGVVLEMQTGREIEKEWG